MTEEKIITKTTGKKMIFMTGMKEWNKNVFTKTIVHANAIATMKDLVVHADHKDKENTVVASTSSDAANKKGSHFLTTPYIFLQKSHYMRFFIFQ